MKRKEYKDLKTKNLKDLMKIVTEKRLEASKAKMGIVTGREKNLKKSLNIKREIAKILTLVREKEIMEKLSADEQKRKESTSKRSEINE